MQEKGVPLVNSMKEITPVQRTVLEYIISHWSEKAKEDSKQNTPTSSSDLNI